MSESDELKKQVDLYKKRKSEADERVKKAVERVAEIRKAQKAQLPHHP